MSHEREDLVQSALLRIVGHHESEGAPREVNATYIWKTAYSVTLDEMRRARWRFERSAGDELSEHVVAGRSPDPEEAASTSEVRAHVLGCLRYLEISRRRAVLMRLSGYNREETAERLGMSPKQIANYVHRGMQDLRRCLQAKGVNA
ncbi:MAG TPA: sigma-70 family RNA polymerase sigma factor [Candidatus Polarisedimenticolaceae bacterium]|nr:sigma-70 family RNA polymerase sigma factor [Candidatus Polarisedimenticolaceae bacterium]